MDAIEKLKIDLRKSLRDTRAQGTYVSVKDVGRIIVDSLGAIDAKILVKWIGYAAEEKEVEKLLS